MTTDRKHRYTGATTSPQTGRWRSSIGRFGSAITTTFGSLILASMANAEVYISDFELNSYDQDGNAVVAEEYARFSDRVRLVERRNESELLNFIPKSAKFTVFGSTGGLWPSTFTGDRFSRCPGAGDHLNQGGNLPDYERLPGIAEFPTSYTHTRNSCSAGGWLNVKEHWTQYLQWTTGDGQPVGFGRSEMTKAFSGSARDASGNWMVFDHIIEPVTIDGVRPSTCIPDYYVKGQIVTANFKGEGPAVDYVTPEPCAYSLTVAAIYRLVSDGPDTDGDNIPDADDNCPDVVNTRQNDFDHDGVGDVCDANVEFDPDRDGVVHDNCKWTPNPDQADLDGDGRGDVCDWDRDGDGFPNTQTNITDSLLELTSLDADNCPDIDNSDQLDVDQDGLGDACDTDRDNDAVPDDIDNCINTANPDQADADNDGEGDACDGDPDGDGLGPDSPANACWIDNCPSVFNPEQINSDYQFPDQCDAGTGDELGDLCDADDDQDSVPDAEDNCPIVANSDQANHDGDNFGDACDADNDNDGIDNPADNCPLTPNVGQDDADYDGVGDVCDADDDNDGHEDEADNCPLTSNPEQVDTDGDGTGDLCEEDSDQDGVDDNNDNCPMAENSSQADFDGDGNGDVCDSDVDGDGIPSSTDRCEFTELTTTVDGVTGCSLAQSCPCNSPFGSTSPWRNKGKFMSCHAKATDSLVYQGLVSEAQKDALQSEAATSGCGEKSR